MSFLDRVRYQARIWFRRSRHDREREEEIGFHLALDAMQNAHSSEKEGADSAARRRFGNVTYHTEEARYMSGMTWVEQVVQDLRFAVRSFRRTPSFVVVAVLTIAVGIGGNTAIFSAVHALLLRPLPLHDPDRLMELSMTRPADGDRPGSDAEVWSVPKFRVIRENQDAFAGVALYSASQVTLRSDRGAEQFPAEVVDPDYHALLGVQAVLGRGFHEEEGGPGSGATVVVASHRFWQRELGADSNLASLHVDLGGERFRVVGVMPEGFRGLTGRAEMWLPMGSQPAFVGEEPWNHSFQAVGRLRPDVSGAGGIAEMHRLGTQADQAYPHPRSGVHWGATARPLNGTRVDPIVRQSVLILLVAVGLVLLIACANVANLFLIRAAGRQREIEVRLALGAARRRLLRQLLTESMLIAATGGVLGLGLAWWGTGVLAALDPTDALRVQRLDGLGMVEFSAIHLDGAALAVTGLLVVVAGVLFGLVPALTATRTRSYLTLGSGRATGAQKRHLPGRMLVVGELALAVLLLVDSGLMIRTLANLVAVDPGFRPEQILTMRVSPRGAVETGALPSWYDRLTEQIQAVPGVTEVALIDCPPLNGGCNGTVALLREGPSPAEGVLPEVGVHWISSNWPVTARVPLLAGRLFDPRDRMGAPKVVLVSETAARTLWPGQDPLGRPISVGQGGFWDDTARVVGVIGDVRFGTLDAPVEADVYLPYAQSPNVRTMLFVRSALTMGALVQPVTDAIHAVSPTIPVFDVQPLSDRVARASAHARFLATLLGLFALVALILAGLGVYGVIAFGVSERRREMGIRAALGASREDVVRMVVAQGARLALSGLVIGVLLALLGTRVLSAILYGVVPSDPATFVVIVAILLGAALLASWIPARRAARVQPVEVLKAD